MARTPPLQELCQISQCAAITYGDFVELLQNERQLDAKRLAHVDGWSCAPSVEMQHEPTRTTSLLPMGYTGLSQAPDVAGHQRACSRLQSSMPSVTTVCHSWSHQSQTPPCSRRTRSAKFVRAPPTGASDVVREPLLKRSRSSFIFKARVRRNRDGRRLSAEGVSVWDATRAGTHWRAASSQLAGHRTNRGHDGFGETTAVGTLAKATKIIAPKATTDATGHGRCVRCVKTGDDADKSCVSATGFGSPR